MTTWQDRFFDRMAHSGYTAIKEVADAAKLAPSTLHTALKKEGKQPKKVTMDKIASALNTTSQYLMFGDEQTEARSFVVPILSRSDILAWIDGKLKIEQCSMIIAAPFALQDGFAWYVDTPDMEPVFQRGDILFFDTSVDTDEWNFCSPVYVLSVRLPETPEKGLLTMTTDNVQNYQLHNQQLLIGELCMTGGALHIRQMNTSIGNLYRQKILAKVCHLLRRI